ncbi:hypothetical protein [Serinicoccus sp. LYQ131]|uniref:hypothetical protein n=1 Tax=Serinicoccus sp. LYQ131 TaxID=3378797 RepID=UPI003854A099
MTQIRGDDFLYRDEPVYGNAEDLVQEVREWAAGQPGFVELGMDRERNGWVTVWVKDADVEAMSEEVAERWPGEGIVVVEVPWSVGELQSLVTEVSAALDQSGVRTGGTALMPHHGVAEIGLGVITPEAEEVLTQFAGRPLCVEGTPADEAPETREQPLSGEGWRMLGQDQTGEAYRTGVATTDDQLDQLWALAGLEGEPATVEWDSEIAVWFGAVYGGGCPVRMDGVVVAGDLLHADLVVPNEVYGCNHDANPHAFVVAVQRQQLPEGPFRVQLEDRDPSSGAPEERTVVDVDLSAPGSTATDEQLHLDPTLALPAEPPLVADGDALHGDEVVRYVYRHDSGCEVPTLGPLGGSRWRLADREAPWDVEDGEEITLYPLSAEQDQIFASTQQMDWVFVRLPDGGTCP